MLLKDRVKLAQELGDRAFRSGQLPIPVYDPEMIKLLTGLGVGEGAPILAAWNHGWHQANLAAPV